MLKLLIAGEIRSLEWSAYQLTIAKGPRPTQQNGQADADPRLLFDKGFATMNPFVGPSQGISYPPDEAREPERQVTNNIIQGSALIKKPSSTPI